MGIILFIVSLLSLPITLFGSIVTFFKFLFKGEFSRINKWFKAMSISIDQFGNTAACGALNSAFRKKGGYSFGKVDETVSSALGKLNREDNLTFFGFVLDKTLNFIEKDHSIKSIEDDE